MSLLAAILQLLGVFGWREMWTEKEREREKGRERERKPCLTVTQHDTAGQDGGGERHKRGGDEEREEIQDGEEGGEVPIILTHDFPVCHTIPRFNSYSIFGVRICKTGRTEGGL